MPSDLSPIDKAKFVAAKKAVEFVEDGMRVGLGTGSTAAWMVRCLGELVREEGLKSEVFLHQHVRLNWLAMLVSKLSAWMPRNGLI